MYRATWGLGWHWARCGIVASALSQALAATAASGDPVRGAQVYQERCGGCHAIDADRVGPRHAGVVGRRAGSVAGFEYSSALAAGPLIWDAANLDRWLSDPSGLIPGERMGYRLGDAAMRADVIAYLASLK